MGSCGLWVKLLSQSICRIIGVYLVLSLYLNTVTFPSCILTLLSAKICVQGEAGLVYECLEVAHAHG